MLPKVLEYAHILIKQHVSLIDVVVNATIGNGYDTLFLSSIIGEKGHVFGYDIQKDAIKNSTELLNRNGCTNVTLYDCGHENILTTIPNQYKGKISGAMFNLGYLPKGNKAITTKSSTTIKAIEQLLSILKVNGIIVIVVYHGHPSGKIEKNDLIQYVTKLDQKYFQVLRYQFINQKNDAPFVIAITKQKDYQ